MIIYIRRRPGDATQQAISDGHSVRNAKQFERVRGWWLLTVAA